MTSLRATLLVLGVLAVLVLVAAGPGTRYGLWDYRTGFLLLRLAAYAGIAVAVLAAVALCLPRVRGRGMLGVALALVLGVVAAAVPIALRQQARSAPLLNDVSEVRVLERPASEAFARARAAAEAMGWDIVAADAAAGRLEAVATTFWFGFKDDVTVRISTQDGQSRVEVRSRSRVGRGDAGTNARRVRAYFEQLQ